MLGAGAQALWSYWRKNPIQLWTLITGLALATALWSGVQAINAEARASYSASASALQAQNYANLTPIHEKTIPIEIFAQLRRAGWLVSPILEGEMALESETIRLIGIDPLTAPAGIAPLLDVSFQNMADFFRPPYQVFGHPKTLAQIGDQLTATKIGLDDALTGVLMADLTAVQDWLDMPGQISRMIVPPDQPAPPETVDLASLGLQYVPPQNRGDIERLTDSFHLNLTAFGLLSFAVGLFIVHAAIGLAFEQRRTLFRTLRALGMPLYVLLSLILGELLLFALIAGMIGMALGYLVAAALLPDVVATLRGLYGAEVDGNLTLRPAWWIAGISIAVMGTLLASCGAFIKTARLPLLASAQPRAWSRLSESRLFLLAVLSGGFLSAALGLLLFGSGLILAFAMLGALLLGAALGLPLLLFWILRIAQSGAKGPVAQWFWADTRQQLSGLSMALMALLLALATNIGVGTMVSSFRLTFVEWLDQRLASELYVRAQSDEQGSKLYAYLQEYADAALPIWHVDVPVNGQPTEIFGTIDHATYRENWRMLAAADGVWDRIHSDGSIAINEQLAQRLDIRIGDQIGITPQWTAKVSGIFGDYGNPKGMILATMPEFLAQFPKVEKQRFGVRIAPERIAPLRAQLMSEFGLPADAMINQTGLKSMSLGVFERTFTVTAALNILTLSVAGFAILTSMITLAGLRRPQLAPVWALGMTRRHLAWLELARTIALALFTAMAALPLGLGLAWVLLNVVNTEAFGWRLPMFLFPGHWLNLMFWAIVAAILAAIWPVYRLAKTAPSEMLKVFAHER